MTPTENEEFCSYNMSAQVAEGNGYTTMKNLNTYIRTLLKGENVLTTSSVELMKNGGSDANHTYGYGCFYKENLGYGHNGARIGNMTIMVYDPEIDVSIISYINAINNDDFMKENISDFDIVFINPDKPFYRDKFENFLLKNKKFYIIDISLFEPRFILPKKTISYGFKRYGLYVVE